MRIFTWSENLGKKECPYLRRWVINFGVFSLRVHHWLSGDDPRNYHDHPWSFITVVLKGYYIDKSNSGNEHMYPGTIRFRPANHSHTVYVGDTGCWTIIITGPIVRKWGFWVNGKFKKANKYFLEHGHHPCK